MGETTDTPPAAASTSGPRLERPGADLPLDAYVTSAIIEYKKDDEGKDTNHVERVMRFPTAVLEEEWKSNSVTVRERAMMAVVDAISDKPGWEDKVSDEKIAAKWRAEALAMPLKQGFSDAMFDHVLAELRDKATLFKTNGAVTSVYDGAAAVFKTDAALDEALVERLKAEVAKLENVDDADKDWHPGSNEQVLDLVHPSLWPLVYGKTRILRDREISLADALSTWGAGETLPKKGEAPVVKKSKWGYMPPPGADRLLSYDFQWLPAEVDVKDGKATFVSYINNLHPEEHKEMYAVLETLVEKALPLWHAAYHRVMQWMGAEDNIHWDDDEKKHLSRIWCMDSNRQCTTPKVCKGYCESWNNPDNPDNQNSDDDEDEDEDDADGDDANNEDDGDNNNDDASEGEGSAAASEYEDVPFPTVSGTNDEDEDDDDDDDDEDDEDVVEADSFDELLNDVEPSEDGSNGDAADDAASEKDNAPPANGDVGDPAIDSDEDDEYAANERWFEATHKVKQPEPTEYAFVGYDYTAPNAFSNKRLQVIVKLANIHLTPEKPTYDGGSWHIEGQLNERIVATALYYYDNDNITDSHLSFRTPCDAEAMCENFQYNQSDHNPFAAIFGAIPGLSDHSTVFEFGKVLTKEGRLLVFPNVLQHRVGSFKLQDKSKPGHRKIVALFLVDPETPVISTANVPPQQMHWGGNVGSVVDQKLPPEIAEIVHKEVGCPFKLDEAKKIRERLIDERKALDKTANKAVNMGEWSFCEH